MREREERKRRRLGASDFFSHSLARDPPPPPPLSLSSGLDAVRSCARVFLEAYTSILTVDTDRLEALYGKPVVVADRETVESVRFGEERGERGGWGWREGAPPPLLSLVVFFVAHARPTPPPSRQNADLILQGADTEDVAFLVVGDPFR